MRRRRRCMRQKKLFEVDDNSGWLPPGAVDESHASHPASSAATPCRMSLAADDNSVLDYFAVPILNTAVLLTRVLINYLHTRLYQQSEHCHALQNPPASLHICSTSGSPPSMICKSKHVCCSTSGKPAPRMIAHLFDLWRPALHDVQK